MYMTAENAGIDTSLLNRTTERWMPNSGGSG